MADPVEKAKDVAHAIEHPVETAKDLAAEAVTIFVGIAFAILVTIALVLYFAYGGK